MDYIMGLCGADGTTAVNIATLSGVVVQRYTVGAINLFCANEKEILHNLAEALITAQMAGYPLQQCRQICAGVAGLHANENALTLMPILQGAMRRCGYKGDAYLTGNEHIALAGALGNTKGAIIMAEDSSICYGQNSLGLNHRTGGFGPLADDDGSAYAIGREILRAVARASDGRGKITNLTAQVYRKFALTTPTSLKNLLRSSSVTPQQICGLAECLALACQAMDKTAAKIADKIAAQLVDLTEPVIARLRLQEAVLAVTGKVLLKDVFVGIAFKKQMNEKFPKLQCVPPRNDAASGAVLLAKERLALRGHV